MKTPNHSDAINRPKNGCRTYRILSGICLILCAFSPRLVAGQAEVNLTRLWAQHYSEVTSNAPDSARRVVVDSAGDVIITGSSDNGLTAQDILTIKYSGLDGSIIWQRRYNSAGNANDTPAALGVDPGGDIVVTGSSRDHGLNVYYTAKYASADGALLWERRDGGEGTNSCDPSALAIDEDGNVVVTGGCETIGVYKFDFYTVKYAASDGATVWTARYDGPGDGHDAGLAVALDSHGNPVVTGFSSMLRSSGLYTVKYAAGDGAVLWSQRYDKPPQTGNVRPLAIAVDADDNAIVTAKSVYIRTEWYTAKYGSDGALVWENHYAGFNPYDAGFNPYDAGFNPYGGSASKPLVVDSAGDVLLGSSAGLGSYKLVKLAKADGTVLWEQRFEVDALLTSSGFTLCPASDLVIAGNFYDGAERGLYLARYSVADGALLWQYRNGTPVEPMEVLYHYNYYDLALAPDGNIVVTGSVPGAAHNGDFSTAKFSTDHGALIWEAQYDGSRPLYAYAQAVAIDDNGDVAVTGPIGKQDSYDYFTAKYAKASGALLWQRRYNGPASSRDEAQALALDSSGNVVVSGSSWHNIAAGIDAAVYSAPADFYTAKYAAADGSLLWERRYNGPADGADLVAAVAVDSHDNVIVTGTSWDGSSADFYAAKYAASDGALLWEQRTSPGMTRNCYVRGMTVDRRGNVVITGDTYDTLGFFSLAIKYAAENGAPVWKKQISSATNGYFHPLSVAADNAGNVLVTGYSYNGSDYDAYTAKYASTDGTLLWEHRYSGPPSRAATASAVGVDHQGNVVITGQAERDFGNLDIFTASYRGSDGMLLWEQRHNGSGNANDYGVALRINRAGNIIVAGNASNGRNLESYLASYSPRDGELLWETTYDGHFDRDNYVANSTGLAVGPDGLIAIAGTGSGYDVATVLYQENFRRGRGK